MRNRLIELLEKAFESWVVKHFAKETNQPFIEYAADYLLENGVVVLNKENNSVEDIIELLKAQIAVLQGWVKRDGK